MVNSNDISSIIEFKKKLKNRLKELNETNRDINSLANSDLLHIGVKHLICDISCLVEDMMELCDRLEENRE